MNISKPLIAAFGGTAAVALALAVATAEFMVAAPVLNWANFPVKAQQCRHFDDATSKPCAELLPYGVAPELYLSDASYRRIVDDHQRMVVTGGAELSAVLVEFTLERIGSVPVKVGVKTIEYLRELKKRTSDGPSAG